MNSKFKSYNSKFLLAGLVSLAPMAADAKTAAENETDTVAADKTFNLAKEVWSE